MFEDAVGETAEPGHHDGGDRQGGHPEQGLHRSQARTRAVPPKFGSQISVHNITLVNERYISVCISFNPKWAVSTFFVHSNFV